MSTAWKNRLYFGDNLAILDEEFQEESVDLIYLDPPFNSNASYNLLFKEKTGEKSSAQIKAFDDTWHWGPEAEAAFDRVMSGGPARLSELLQSFRLFMGEKTDMMAYIAMMAPRLVQLHKVLKETGTLYLHCDPTASHYLKLVLDAIFGPERFLNEVIWKRTHSHGDAKRNFGSVFDSILIYTKSADYKWNAQKKPLSQEHIDAKFRYKDPDDRVWQSVTLRSPNPRPNLHYPYTASNGVTYQPHPNGWSCDPVRMKQYDDGNRLHFPSKEGGQLRLKMYLDETKGMHMQNVWDDIYPINSQAKERLGYPTQKPEDLLERIIRASSDEGDVVLDPFCGGGTTMAVAERLNRHWMGIDITVLAINLTLYRLQKWFGTQLSPIKITGLPVDLSGAEKLAELDRYTFQVWAAALVGLQATPKGSDRGVDGVGFFKEDGSGKHKKIIGQVKSGAVKSGDIRDFAGTMSREKADLGVFICLASPTRDMKTEAASVGLYSSGNLSQKKVPKLQILTIEDLLDSRGVQYPSMVLETTHALGKKQLKGEAAIQGTLL